MLIQIAFLLSFFVVSSNSEKCLTLLDVRVKGSPYAGRIEVCYWFDWWPVCANTWTDISAGVVCRQLNFTNSIHQEHSACGHNCFGSYDSINRTLEVICSNQDSSNLKDCNVNSIDGSDCDSYAGIFCDVRRHNTENSDSSEQIISSSTQVVMDNCRTVNGVLGGTVVILMLVLLTVLACVIYFCHRGSVKSPRFIMKPNDNEVTNPTYDAEFRGKVNPTSTERNRLEHKPANGFTSNHSSFDNSTAMRVRSASLNTGHYDLLIACNSNGSLQAGERDDQYYSVCRKNTEVQGYEVPLLKNNH